MFCSLSQLQKAYHPIEITELGISIFVSSLHPPNAPSPILVTVFGIEVFLHPTIRQFEDVSIIALQFSRESKVVLPVSTEMLVSPIQPQNASKPI